MIGWAKRATTGRPKAPATCMGPESLVMTRSTEAKSAMSWRTEVTPIMLRAPELIFDMISEPMAASPGPPTSSTLYPKSEARASATFANLCGYHLFAEP